MYAHGTAAREKTIKTMWNKKSYDEVSAWFDANEKTLNAEDEAARKAGTLLGRIVRIGVADGCATYQITKVNKRTVFLTWCNGLGNDYFDWHLGGGRSYPIADIQRFGVFVKD